MPTLGDALGGLADIYNKDVKKADEKGTSELFKNSAEIFFKTIVSDAKNVFKIDVTIEDIKYLDGYFIFGTGTNSIVHFHIKECPGWLFAIWWKHPEDVAAEAAQIGVDEDTEEVKEKQPKHVHIEGQFFTQYEDTIDKFKPSRSAFCEDIFVDLTELECCSGYRCCKVIKFISTEPNLAFCRDYCGWDYNSEYHTRAQAKREFDKYVGQEIINERVKKENNDIVINWVKENILPAFVGAEIIDRGENWYPRFDMIAPLEDNTEFFPPTQTPEPGCYGWYETDDKRYKEWKKFIKLLAKKARKQHVWWHEPLYPDVTFFHKQDIEDDNKAEAELDAMEKKEE